MKIEICNDDKCFPFLLVDDWYNSEEEDLIWKELDFYTNHYSFIRSEDDSGSASFEDGTPKAMPNVFSDEVKDAIKKTTAAHRNFLTTNRDATVVNYYEDGEDYKPHFDTSIMTVIIWFHKSPKAYDGGDFIFTDSGIKVESNHNRMVMFPCFYEHEAEPVILNNAPKLSGLGRYSIVHFYYRV